MVLAEHAAEWFEIDSATASPYMSFAVPVRSEKRVQIQAVVHQDGTARVQTVYQKLTPRTYELLKSWQKVSGIPVLLNTSFNDREPIVQQPSEALATFLRLPLDGIYFADYELLVTREHSPETKTNSSVADDRKTPANSVRRIKNWIRKSTPR